MDITITGLDETDTLLRDYPTRTQRAFVRSANRAIASGRTVMVREIARDVGLAQKDVRAAIWLQEATAGRPEARIGASLKRIPLIKFHARGPEPSYGKGRGVSYRLRGGRGRHPHAFIATMKSGHRGVFVRAGKPRLPIRELLGPSLGQVFRKYRPLGMARVTEMFDRNFAHELKFAAAEGGGGLGAGTDAGTD